LRKYRLIALLVFASASASAADHSRFWNLTSVTITKLYLTPAGTTNWSGDQCENDDNGTVLVKSVKVKSTGAYSFSLNDKDLTDCSK
jgi:hypothetical protein